MQPFDKDAPPLAPYAAAYIRASSTSVSTEESLEAEKEGQVLDCESIARSLKLDPAALVLYTDWACSGSESAKRPAQDRLIAEIKAGHVTHVVARASERLMRSIRKNAEFIDVVKKHNVMLVTQREGEIRDDNPSNWAFNTIIVVMAEYESRVDKARAAKGIATKHLRGTPIGRTARCASPSTTSPSAPTSSRSRPSGASPSGTATRVRPRDALWSPLPAALAEPRATRVEAPPRDPSNR